MKKARFVTAFSGMLAFAVLAIHFQNCSPSSDFNGQSQSSHSESPSGGAGSYDGKVFVELNPSGACPDSSNANAEIVLSSVGTGMLTRENCQVNSPAVLINASELSVDGPRGFLTYKGRTFVQRESANFWLRSSTNPESIYFISSLPSGNVGIGTSAPFSTLHVNGEVQVGSSGRPCSADTAGAMRYDSGRMEYCNGSAWTPLDSASVPGTVCGSRRGTCTASTTVPTYETGRLGSSNRACNGMTLTMSCSGGGPAASFITGVSCPAGYTGSWLWLHGESNPDFDDYHIYCVKN